MPRKRSKIIIPIKRRGINRFMHFRLKRKVVLLAVPILLLIFFIFKLWGLALVIFIFIIAKEMTARRKKTAALPIERDKGYAQRLVDEVRVEDMERNYADNLIKEIIKEEKTR